jgi:hypothetical protein
MCGVTADHEVELELLRTQLLSCRAQMAGYIRQEQRVVKLLQRYLEVLFPHLLPQALAARMSIAEAADYLYVHHLNRDDPLDILSASDADTLSAALESAAISAVELSGDAVALLSAVGRNVLSTEIKQIWAAHTGKAAGTARNLVLPELLDAGLLRVERLAVPRYLTGYATDTYYLLTEAGQQEYRRRFNAEPTTYEEAYAPYKSPEAWWQIRATQALIEAGTDHSANSRFSYTVYDPAGDPDATTLAGFQARYGHSEPDLIVAVTSKTGGPTSQLVVECERGSYSSTRLKQKVVKNLQDYGEAGFSGCYYIVNSNATARTLAGAITKVREDLRERPDALSTRSFLALFTLEALRDAWLPTPHFIDAHFFDRKARRVSDDWPSEAAKPERYLKFVSSGQDGQGGQQ